MRRRGVGLVRLCHDGWMTDRLSATDAAFLYAEDAGSPMHVGGVVILGPDGPDGAEFQYSDIVDLIESRLSLVPRYRQKVRFVPGRLARPVWVDDEDFDVTYHVRRSALPRPGSDDQLQEFHRLADRCEHVYGAGRDIEWAIAGWTLYLLQCRAITKAGG